MIEKTKKTKKDKKKKTPKKKTSSTEIQTPQNYCSSRNHFIHKDLSDKIKHNFFQIAVASILLYGCTTWTLTKRIEKNLTAIAQGCY